MKTFRVRLDLSYKGTYYQGWQVQRPGILTVQGVLEEALAKICGRRIHIQGSGRTDAGVHARIQVAHADLPEDRSVFKKSPEKLVLAMNSLLPQNIRIYRVTPVSETFHAQMSVEKKMYLYWISPGVVAHPFAAEWSWSLKLPLDVERMQRATRYFVGTHDFKAYCASDSTAKTTIRTVNNCKLFWTSHSPFDGMQSYERGPKTSLGACLGPSYLVFGVIGEGFLKHMVRRIVGNLVQIGTQKLPPENVRNALKSGALGSAGPTAPAEGLWLWDILYLTKDLTFE